MPSLTLLPKKDFLRSTWKNGLGFTDQIAIYPPGAGLAQGNFLWRLSSARIEKASPFSVFPYHDRILLVLKGAGIRLIHTFEEGGEEETIDLPPLESYEFPGDVPSRCELMDGPIIDFSIFLRKAEVEPLVEIVEIAPQKSFSWSAQGRWNFAFAVSGNFQTSAGTLEEGGAASIERNQVESESDATLIEGRETHGKLLLISLG